MLPSLIAGLYYQEIEAISMLLSIGITMTCGQILKGRWNIKKITRKEAFYIVTIGWLLISLFGALPYFLSSSCALINAFFESISGFTTTGATIFSHPERLSKTILLWRSTTQWIGGMGIILLYLALLPEIRGDYHLYYARGPNLPFPYRSYGLKKRIGDIWLIYLTMTVLLFLLLVTIGRLTPFQSLLFSLTTISTGGFSSHSSSIPFFHQRGAIYSLILFMVLSSMSFKNYLLLFTKERRKILQDKEPLLYLSILISATCILSLHIYREYSFSSFYLSLFQTTSIISTTAFATIDYDSWSSFAKALLILLMLLGGSSGSTAGGIKIRRIYHLCQLALHELDQFIHGKKRRYKREAQHMLSYFFLYLLVISFLTLALTYQGLDLMSAFTAAAATLGNIGPGLGLFGPQESYGDLNSTSKMLLSLAMLLGRLEFYPVLAFIYLLFTPASKTNSC